MARREKDDVELLRRWPIPSAAMLGSSVRAKGILLEMRARLPAEVRKQLVLDGTDLVLVMPATAKTVFHAASGLVSLAMKDVERLAVIPREIEDILTIKPGERHRWLADGRLPSAGTRTVRLAGRAKKITFHVFDPKMVEELLDTGMIEEWREEDKAAAAENRRRAAYQAKLTRSLRKTASEPSVAPSEDAAGLTDWDAFGRDGLLR